MIYKKSYIIVLMNRYAGLLKPGMPRHPRPGAEPPRQARPGITSHMNP